MPSVEGVVLTPAGFRRRRLVWDHATVEAIEVPGHGRKPLAKGLVVPTFFNAHTHLGDAVVQGELPGSLEDLVAPPRGLKHRILESSPPERIMDAMRRAAEQMLGTGTTAFADFREGGASGIKLMKSALEGLPLNLLILGRPARLEYRQEEVRELLRATPGIAVSAARDWPQDDLEKLARHVRSEGGVFALHASEGVREELDPILDLRPTFLVHMTKATVADWERCAEAGIPVAVCPRSQAFFGQLVDLPAMTSAGLTLMLGTDNAMLASPSMLREMEFAHRVARLRGDLPSTEILTMAYAGGEVLGKGRPRGLEVGGRADFLVLHTPLDNPGPHLILRALDADVILVVSGGKAFRYHGGSLQPLASGRAHV